MHLQCCRYEFEHVARSNHYNFWHGQGFKDFIPLVGTDTVDIEDLRPCSGCVVQNGVSKVAVYKDGQGNVHKYSGMQTPLNLFHCFI